MKKLAVSVILIIIAAAAAFYFGAVSYRIDSESAGILFSKTRGWSEHVLQPGEFFWFPDALIPTNVTLYKIPDKTYKWHLSLSGELPDAATYQSYLEVPAEFSWSAEISITYRINKDWYPRLFKNEGLRPDKIDDFLSVKKIMLQNRLLASYSLMFEDIMTVVETNTLLETVTKTIATEMPWLQHQDVHIIHYGRPNLALYQRTRDIYHEEMESRTRLLLSGVAETTRIRTEQNTRLELLRHYGELFTEYPELIDFLALDTTNANLLFSIMEQQN